MFSLPLGEYSVTLADLRRSGQSVTATAILSNGAEVHRDRVDLGATETLYRFAVAATGEGRPGADAIKDAVESLRGEVERDVPVPDEAAFHGLSGGIANVVDPHTEADPRRHADQRARPGGGGDRSGRVGQRRRGPPPCQPERRAGRHVVKGAEGHRAIAPAAAHGTGRSGLRRRVASSAACRAARG